MALDLGVAVRRIALAGVVAVSCLWIAAQGRDAARSAGREGTVARVSSAYSQLPLSFEPNVGQSDPWAQFVAHGSGATLQLGSREAVLSLPGRPSSGRSLRLQFPGARRAALAGADRLFGTVNYFVGSDRSRWRAGVPTYARVRYTHLWPGIDASFYGSRSRLEYDLELHPGADPRRIGLRFSGASSVRIDARGDLRLALAGGRQVRELAPLAYQLAGGRRRVVASRFVLSAGLVRIALGRYDHGRSLIVDPTLVYSTYLGGSGLEQGNGIALDKEGHVYVAGFTESTDFPQQGAHGSGGGGGEAFVTKLNSAGGGPVYSTYIGGRGFDAANGIAVDAEGNAYLTGETEVLERKEAGKTIFEENNFPTTEGALQESCGDGVPKHPLACPAGDAFVTKLDPAGAVVYSTYVGGTGADEAMKIAVDSTGQAYVTGDTKSVKEAGSLVADKFPITVGSSQGSCADELEFEGPCELGDAFVAKLNATGSKTVYATYLGGNLGDLAGGIAVDPEGNAYVTGFTTSISHLSTPGSFQPSKGGGSLLETDAFVAELNAAGSERVYSTYLGGSRVDAGLAIAVDSQGEAYVTGFTLSSDFKTAHAEQPSCGDPGCSHPDAFVTKLSSGGDALDFSTYLGGSARELGRGIALDGLGGVYVTGSTTSTNLPTLEAFQSTNGGREDAFVVKLDAASGTPLYASYLGGSGGDSGRSIAVDAAGGAYITGFTKSAADFPLRNALQPNYGGPLADAFVAKFAPPDTTAPVSAAAAPLCHGPATVTVTDGLEGSGPRAVHFRLDGGPEHVTRTAGDPGTAAIAYPEGSHTLEYWGEDAAGNQERLHHALAAKTDTTPPEVRIIPDQHFSSYELGYRAAVTISARDATSGLLSDPSGQRVLDTASASPREAAISVTDHCANSAAAHFRYTVIPNPSLGRTVNLQPTAGAIALGLPGGAAADLAEGARQVPVGTHVNAAAGEVAVTAARSRHGGLQTGSFRGGRFKVLQNPKLHGLAEARVLDNSCARAGGSHELGSLRASVAGSFRTRGRYSSATSRGAAAAWTITDRCGSTLIRVTRGSVIVHDAGSRKRSVIRAGAQHRARAR